MTDLEKENERLKDALELAILVIENYQMDISNYSFMDSGETLESIGFCQGSIYKNAIQNIKKIVKGDD
jgi:hypothetical protein